MSAKVVSLPSKSMLDEPVQTHLWEITDEPGYTNTIDLLDIAPRWVLYTDSDVRQGGKFLDSVERTFIHNGKSYKLVLKPARIARNGSEIEEYPGSREQLVEQVIRKLAVTRNRVSVRDDNLVMQFTINEVREELRRRKHSFRYAEVKEALMILHGAIVEISRTDDDESGRGKVNKVISASAFPQVTFREKGQENTVTTLQFNWLVAEALKRLQFRQMNYDMMMKLKDPLARWLYTRLTHDVLYGGHRAMTHEINALDIHRDCGLPRWKAMRNMLARITKAVDVLRREGVIEDYESEDVCHGQRKDDIIYTIRVSNWFMQQIKRSDRKAVEIISDYRDVAGGNPVDFGARLTPQRRSALGRIRAVRRDTERDPGLFPPDQ